MSDLQSFKKCMELALLKLKESDISIQSKPDEIKSLFKKVLSLNNPYWQANADCDKLTRLGLIFKPQQAYIQKGKPIYVALSFEGLGVLIDLEEQYARTSENSFEVPYEMMLNTWDEFADSMISIFNRAAEMANGIR